MKKDFRKQKKVNIKAIVFRALMALIVQAVIVIGIVKFSKNPGRYNWSDIALFVTMVVSFFVIYFSLLSMGKTDAITRLPTADAFTFTAVRVMLKRNLQYYAVLFINLKNFKHINRILGTVGGDQALYKYAQVLNNFLIKGEHVGRLGGDNFIVLIYKHRLSELIDLLKNISVEVDAMNGVQDVQIYSRAGIYTLSDRDTVGELFNNSSIALAYAKCSNAEDFVWFQKYMLEQTYEEKEIAYTFMNAIKNKEFKVYYQPKVNIETNRICGGEALVRWERNGQLSYPDSFIPSLEKSGLITTLDFYVMSQVCKDLRNWKEKKLKVVPISSNFSKPHLRDKSFVHKVMATITEYKIERNLFQVEVSESIGEDLAQLKSFFSQLHVSGISTLIDDFGTGGFSWTLLKDPNIDAVKLDKSVIENVEVNGGANDDSLLARNIIHACYDLRKEIICEGVENIAQRDMLMGMRCNIIQGFLYDEPLPADEFEKLLAKEIYTEI